jgi:hypothetical protein
VARMREESGQGFGGKARRKETTRKTRRRWEYWISIGLGEILGCVCVVWIKLFQDKGRWQAVVNAVMKLRVLAPRS